MLLRSLNDHAAALAGGSTVKTSTRNEIVRQMQGNWCSLPPGLRAHFAGEAEQHVKSQREALDSQLHELRCRLQLEQMRLEQEARSASHVPHRLASSRFSEADIVALSALWSREDTSAARVMDMRGTSWTSPTAPSSLEQKTIEMKVSALFPHVEKPIPPWLRCVCLHRVIFENTIIFRSLDGAGVCAYGFLYATQRPYSCMLLPLTVKQLVTASDAALSSDFVSVGQSFSMREFSFKPLVFLQECDVDWPNIEDLFVLPDAMFVSAGTVVSDAEPWPFKGYVERFAGPMDRTGVPSSLSIPRPPRLQPTEALLLQHPWLADYIGGGSRGVGGGGGGGHHRVDAVMLNDMGDEDQAGLARDARAALWAELEDRKSVV